MSPPRFDKIFMSPLFMSPVKKVYVTFFMTPWGDIKKKGGDIKKKPMPPPPM